MYVLVSVDATVLVCMCVFVPVFKCVYVSQCLCV